MAQAPLITSTSPTSPLHLENVQGDILLALPKLRESFFFFQIESTRIQQFRSELKNLIPIITTSKQCLDDRRKIQENKKTAKQHGSEPAILELSGVNIAFSQKGLKELGLTDNIGDPIFSEGMLADAPSLNDNLNNWDPRFKKEIDGVILVTGNNDQQNAKTLTKVKEIFHFGQADSSIQEVIQLDGKVRPGKERGHEHFGFSDGISQPSVAGIPEVTVAGQDTIRQGVILVGREGDDGTFLPSDSKPEGVSRPSWALDGSFLAFRYLKQLVPEFNAFLDANALPTPPGPIAPGDPTGSEFLGARLVGRWKSGAPVDLTPVRDDPALGANDQQNNNFVYDAHSQTRCPFAAHTRKTNPRSDFTSVGLSPEPHRILRRAIQFGPEVTEAEQKAKKSSDDEKLERGLLFVSYQSNLSNGFHFVQQSWANAPGFPPFKTAPPTSPPVPNGPGFDAIIGQGATREIAGTNPNAATAELTLTNEWVVSKGGEYFFSPSLPTLKHIAA